MREARDSCQRQRSHNMHLARELLGAVKRAAKQCGIPDQRFIRQALEEAGEGSG